MKKHQDKARLINKDGSFRVRRIGVNNFTLSEFYNSLVTLSWSKFFLLVFVSYLVIASLFTLAYIFTDLQNLKGLTAKGSTERFWEIFFYSAQTMSTVGGAGITPVGITNNLVLTIESMTALLCMAIITGLLYVRFSRPSVKIVYSNNALIAPLKGGKALMFRIGDGKRNGLSDLFAHLTFIVYDPTTNKRTFNELPLEKEKVPFIAQSWTIVHPVEEGSPFFDFDRGQLEKMEWDLMIALSGVDSITGQSVFSRYSYSKHDLVWNARFLTCSEVNEQGETLVYLNKLGDYEELRS